jgi:hypothetical protein
MRQQYRTTAEFLNAGYSTDEWFPNFTQISHGINLTFVLSEVTQDAADLRIV